MCSIDDFLSKKLQTLTHFNTNLPMKKTLVFGASLRPYRYSNLAMKRLVEHNVDTVAFGLREGTVAGVQVSNKLAGFQNVHTITLYMNPDRQKAFYGDLIHLSPKRVIFNPGTENPELYALLRKHGIEVEVACTLVLLATGKY